MYNISKFAMTTVGLIIVAISAPFFIPPRRRSEPADISIAFVGNSIQYYNDFPRVMEYFGQGHIVRQNACLRGGSTFTTLLQRGSGTAFKFNSTNALIPGTNNRKIYDYGACTLPQLFFGKDVNLKPYSTNNDDDDDNDDDASIYQYGLYDKNPCYEDLTYYEYLEEYYSNRMEKQSLHWDYVVLNDNTLGPAVQDNREDHLQTLLDYYVPWFQQLYGTSSETDESSSRNPTIPIFIHTHAYWTLDKMGTYKSTLVDIPTFTSKTYAGIQQYVDTLQPYLDVEPRIAPVGLAFLLIWEENYEFWKSRLFHSDNLHPSPHGTFLQACVVYYTIYGVMPPPSPKLFSTTQVWKRARYMQPLDSTPINPLPTYQEAQYLYSIAERVCKYGVVPESFIYYESVEDFNEN